MNKVVLMGRLTKDPEVRYSQSESPTAIANYTIAVDRRRGRSNGQDETDFIRCVAYGKGGEFAEKYLRKGIKIAVTGHIQTGKYTNKEGQTVYTTDVVVESQEIAESKAASGNNGSSLETTSQTPQEDAFMVIPDGVEEELPFN